MTLKIEKCNTYGFVLWMFAGAPVEGLLYKSPSWLETLVLLIVHCWLALVLTLVSCLTWSPLKKIGTLDIKNKHKAPWSVDIFPCLWIALSAKLAMYNINNTLLWLYWCAGIEPSPAHHLLAHPRVYSAVVRAGTSIIVPGPPIMQWLLVTRRCVGCL